MLMDMDQELFQECQRRFHEEETKAIRTQEKHEMTWQCWKQLLLQKLCLAGFGQSWLLADCFEPWLVAIHGTFGRNCSDFYMADLSFKVL
jgi:hypothetical protein